MSENILNMFCSKCNHEFAINLPKCPDCGEPVTEKTKESLIHWASFGIFLGVASIVLAVSTSFPNSPVHRVYQVILIVMGLLLIFSGLRQFLSSRGKILRRGLGTSLCITGLALFVFAAWMVDAYFRGVALYDKGFMMLLGLVSIAIGSWQFTILAGNAQVQNTSKLEEISL